MHSILNVVGRYHMDVMANELPQTKKNNNDIP